MRLFVPFLALGILACLLIGVIFFQGIRSTNSVHSIFNPDNHGIEIAGLREIASIERELNVCDGVSDLCTKRWTGIDVYIDSSDKQHQILRFLEREDGKHESIEGTVELVSTTTVFFGSIQDPYYIENPRAFKFGL